MNRIWFYLVCVAWLMPWSVVFAASHDAKIQFANRSEMSLPVSGTISKVYVKSGQRVRAGEVMVALDKTPFEVDYARTEADVTYKTTLEQEAKRDYEQSQELFDRGVLSTVELENSKNKHIRASAELKSAKAQLVQAEYNLMHSEIVAPGNGWVLKVQANENESINSTLNLRPVVTYAEEGQYIAKLNLSNKGVGSIKIGQAGTITVGGKKFRGIVSAIAFEPVAPNKDSYEVELKFISEKTVFRSGQKAKVDF